MREKPVVKEVHHRFLNQPNWTNMPSEHEAGDESKPVAASRPVPDKPAGRKTWTRDDERSLKKDGHAEVSLKAEYDFRKVREQAFWFILVKTLLGVPTSMSRGPISCSVGALGERHSHPRSNASGASAASGSSTHNCESYCVMVEVPART